MDDLLLCNPDKQFHKNKFEYISKVLLKNGLKVVPKKCHLFKERVAIYGQYHFNKGKECMCKAYENKDRGYQG